MKRLYKGYVVHSDGRIEKKSGKGFINQYQSKDGYWLFKPNGVSKKAHRFVWEAFNGKIPDDMTIDHIDGDKCNNDLRNLRLMTREDNTSIANRQVSDNDIKSIKYLKSLGWLQREIAEELGYTQATISYVLNKKLRYTQ